jgi:hypothetical protein
MTVSLTDAFVPAPDVVFRELDGEAVVLDLAGGTYFGLNASGTRMWQLIQEHRELEPVAVALAGEFDAPSARIESDLLTFVSHLERKGLLIRA